MKTVWLVLILVTTSTSLGAQWLTHPSPGIPRTADGKPDLAAAAPRTPDGNPDLSGMWQMHPGSYVVNMTQDLNPDEIQPWAEKRYQEHLETFAKDPSCHLPSGPRYYIAGLPKIVQTPDLIIVLNEDLTYRQIFLDGRTLPHDPNPSFMGYSTGHWEGDTLVVESEGFNDRTLLDTGGHPHTEGLRVTERFHRRDVGHMDLQVTFGDPKVYAKPLVVPVSMQLVADDELIEFICRENEKDYLHIVGKSSDGKVDVALDVLAQYVGIYEVRSAQSPTAVVNVTFESGALFLDRTPWIPGKDRQSLIPMSATTFAGHFGRRMRFEKDDRGVVTRLVFEAPEPSLHDLTAVRQNGLPPGHK
jgi:hypothetical protein